MSLQAVLAAADTLVGLYLASTWPLPGLYLASYAVRRQRQNRDLLDARRPCAAGCALILAVLALPDEQPNTLEPAPGQLV